MKFRVENELRFVVVDDTNRARPFKYRWRRLAEAAASFENGEMPTRDSQRSKLYEAERTVEWERLGSKAMTLNECQAFVDKVLASKYVKGKYGDKYAVWVRDGRGSPRGRVTSRMGGWQMLLPTHARTTWYVLHEVAHVLVGTRYEHRWPFAMVELDLVRHFMGADAERALKLAFRTKKVKFGPKRDSYMSEEQREQARNRLASARAAKVAAGTPES